MTYGYRCDPNISCSPSTPSYIQSRDETYFDYVIDVLRSEIAMASTFTIKDASARALYQIEIAKVSNQLRRAVLSGNTSWSSAAQQATNLRNDTMSLLRAKSSPIGRAIAEYLKANGRSLNDLIAHNTVKSFGETVEFTKLSDAQKSQVYAKIVDSAGRSSPRVDLLARRAGYIGRGLIVLSLGVAVYNIAVAEDKASAAAKEGSLVVGGIAGGVAGGALAGLACGPGAPVCVTIGAFIGGAAAAIGVSLFF